MNRCKCDDVCCNMCGPGLGSSQHLSDLWDDMYEKYPWVESEISEDDYKWDDVVHFVCHATYVKGLDDGKSGTSVYIDFLLGEVADLTKKLETLGGKNVFRKTKDQSDVQKQDGIL